MMEIARYKKNEYLQELDNLIKTLNEASDLGIDVSNVYQEVINLKEQIEELEDKALDRQDDEIKLELTYYNPSFDYKYKLDDIKRNFPTELKVLLEKNINILELPEWIKDVIKKNPLWKMDIINNIENIIAKNYINILEIIPELYRYIPREEKKDNLEMAKMVIEKDDNLLSSVPLILINSNREEFREAFIKHGIDLDECLKGTNILFLEVMCEGARGLGNEGFDSLEEIPEHIQMMYPDKVLEIVEKTGSLKGTCAKWQMENLEIVTKIVKTDYDMLKYTCPEWQIANSELVSVIVSGYYDMLKYTCPEWQTKNSEFVAQIIKRNDDYLKYTSSEWQIANSELVSRFVSKYHGRLKYTSSEWQIANSEFVSGIVSEYSAQLKNTSPEWQMANSDFVAQIIKRNEYYLEYTSPEWQVANSEFVKAIARFHPLVSEYVKLQEANTDKDVKVKDNTLNKKPNATYALNLTEIAKIFPVSEEELLKYSRTDVQYLVKAIQSCEYKKLEHINKIIAALKKEKNNIPTQENMGVVAKEILQHQAKESLLKTAEERVRSEIAIIEQEIDADVAREFTDMLQQLQQEKTIDIFDDMELYKMFQDKLMQLYGKVNSYLQFNINPEVLKKETMAQEDNLPVAKTKKENIFVKIINKIKNSRNKKKTNDNSDGFEETKTTNKKTEFKVRLKADVDVQHSMNTNEKSSTHKEARKGR